MQTPTGKFSEAMGLEPQRFPRFLDKMGKMMSEDYDWSADIVEAADAGAAIFCRQRLGLAEAHCRVLRAVRRGRERSRALAEHAADTMSRLAVVLATAPLQFHNLAGSAADCRQVLGRSTHQSAGKAQPPPRRSPHRAEKAQPRTELGPDQETRLDRQPGHIRSASAPSPRMDACRSQWLFELFFPAFGLVIAGELIKVYKLGDYSGLRRRPNPPWDHRWGP